MAIKLSRDLQAKTTTPEGTGTSKGFDIVATPGVNYDADKIAAGKNRKDPAAELLAELSGAGKSVGSISVSEREEKIFANTCDAKKYLFRNEASTDAYTPSVTLRRPIVIWEEGTTDKNLEEDIESLYDTIYALQDEVKKLKEELANERANRTNTIELFNNGTLKTEGTLIPDVQAIFDFVKQYVFVEGVFDEVVGLNKTDYKTILANSKIIEAGKNEFKVDLSEDYYKLAAKTGNGYSLIIGGK